MCHSHLQPGATDKSENVMNKEFQHSVETKLIEVMKMKMQMFQFMSIVTSIQVKLIKGIDNMKNRMNKEFQHSMESRLIEVMKVTKKF
jgi:hypothetical protein